MVAITFQNPDSSDLYKGPLRKSLLWAFYYYHLFEYHRQRLTNETGQEPQPRFGNMCWLLLVGLGHVCFGLVLVSSIFGFMADDLDFFFPASTAFWCAIGLAAGYVVLGVLATITLPLGMPKKPE